MTTARLSAILGLVAAATAFRAEAYEVNAWPVFVAEKDVSGETVSWTGAGPFLFSTPTPAPEAGTAKGFSPFLVRTTGEGSVRTDVLFPLFNLRKYPGHYRWSIFELINREGIDSSVTQSGGPLDRHFDIWPFYFSHVTGDPVDTYHALLPIYGTIKYRLGFDQLHWVLFPIYVHTYKRSTNSNYVPWPFVRVISGAANGFAIWPLFGITKGPGPARNKFFVWPLIWDNVLEPPVEAPEGTAPGTETGFLPIFTHETAPGYVDTNFLWPFFGYTDRTLPYRYHETRYFWPFLVQGRGDQRYRNRWGPVYTHSDVKGSASTWVGWPFWHQTKWVDSDTAETKTQFFYFAYWSLYETSVSRPSLAPAYKRHIWPILSLWDNGAGSRQVQFPSPLEVFFPSNPEIRQSWGPLFAVYRYNHQPTGEARTSLLWNAVTWRSNGTEGLVEFHVGPLLGLHKRPSGDVWTILGFDFGGNVGKITGSNRSE
jgi:hypothetical protein